MWKTFQHNEELFMIKLLENDNDLAVYLTDLQCIWCEELPEDTTFARFKELNPLINIKKYKCGEEIKNLVNGISELQNIELTRQDDGEIIQLTLVSTIVKPSLKIQFTFAKLGPEDFLKHVTVPLVQTVKHLEENQNRLSNLVQKKDRELEEYKLEKGSISREDLITEKFNEDQLSKIDDKSMMRVFGESESFWESFTNKFGRIETKLEDVQKDPWNHIKRKRKVYSAKTAAKKGKGISYNKSE